VANANPVLIDTDIFSSVYVTPGPAARRGLPVDDWRRALEGARVLITFQTRAEILAGACINNWGERRVSELRELLDTTPTIGADRAVIDAYARFRAACRNAGHPLNAKQHNADRWNAASAIAKGLPLFAHDGIYAKAPGLTLFVAPTV
jgi:predicted nucleic acid-binding protein